MALSGSGLRDAVVAALEVYNPEITGQAKIDLEAAWLVIADAIVNYLKANTEVSVDTPISVPVTPFAASFNGTGTIT